MQRLEKLKLNYEFRRAYAKGKPLVAPCLVIYAAKGKKGRARLGITAGKKIGGAVERNRAKRVITAAFRECLPNIKQDFDYVIVARSGILKVKSTVAAAHMKRLLKGAGYWCEDNSYEEAAD